MEINILGPFEATRDGRPVALAGRERVLLALLAVWGNHTVSSERLADELWSGRPPNRAAEALRVHVSRLRRALREAGADGLLATRPRGYSLQVEPAALDARRFEVLLGEARRQAAAGDLHAAADRLREGLGLWRGPALADVADTPLLQTEAARLEEARLAALEERIDADLALGRHSELTAELDALTRAYPLRERLWAQRMVALYRSGRQTEALRAYQDVRRFLGDELGIEPGVALRQLEGAILGHDPELDWRIAPPAAPAVTVPADTAAPCPGCGAVNPAGARFCGSCGAALWRPCPSCGFENPGGHRFCARCGQALDTEETAERRSALTEERRWATVLFADLSGFTSLYPRPWTPRTSKAY